MAQTSAGFVARAVEAADALRACQRRHAFERAAWNFVELLAIVPDYPAGDFADADIARIRMLAEDVIAQIEERAAEDEDSSKTAVQLVSTVYAIRNRLEQIDIWRRHFARVQ